MINFSMGNPEPFLLGTTGSIRWERRSNLRCRAPGYEREGEGARLIRAYDIEHAAGPAGSTALAGADRLSFSPRSGELPQLALISDSSSLFRRVNPCSPKNIPCSNAQGIGSESSVIAVT